MANWYEEEFEHFKREQINQHRSVEGITLPEDNEAKRVSLLNVRAHEWRLRGWPEWEELERKASKDEGRKIWWRR